MLGPTMPTETDEAICATCLNLPPRTARHSGIAPWREACEGRPTRSARRSAVFRCLPMLTDAPHTFEDVLVVHEIDSGWLCEITARRVFVERRQIQPGTSVPTVGTRGPLTVRGLAVPDIHAKLVVRAAKL